MRFQLQQWISRIVLSPSILVMAIFLYGFIGWTGYISMTPTTMIPRYDFVGLAQYGRLWGGDRWLTSFGNLFLFGGLFLFTATVVGLLLAIMIDQRIRFEGLIRSIILYPMAMSFVVTGVVWQWLLNPTFGLEHIVRSLGFESFRFDWLINPSTVILAVVLAAVWQGAGLVMALFLAGLRGIDEEIWKATRIDAVPTWRVYLNIILPMLRPVFLTVIVLMSLNVVRSFDLVVALTNGGPGVSSDLPSIYMFDMAFRRNNLALGAAAAVMMLSTVLAILIPYLYAEAKERS